MKYANDDIDSPKPTKSRSEPLKHSNLTTANKKKRPSEFSLEYQNENHVTDFLQALAQDHLTQTDSSPEHIQAASELMPPLRGKDKKKKKKKKQDEIGTPKGIAHALFKYPFIVCIGFIIFIELSLYLGLRQAVRIWENFFSWRGRRRKLRNDLRASQSYEEWCQAANELDKYMKKEEWKASPEYGYYDYRLIQKVIKHLRLYRGKNDLESITHLKDVLYVCLKQNFAGIENSRLYSNTYLGTKYLIDEYVDEVTLSIEALANSPHVSYNEKRLAFRLYSKNYGKSAFCLSGGAGFGYFHLGVIRALLDQQLLPPIITGTSAGSLMGAIVCTRTDDELREVLVPELAHRIKIAHDSWITKLTRYATTGAIFDCEHWCREAMWFTRGSLTFKEAYERTGRIFNVSVVPFDAHSPPKLLNYITAPNCVIWSAILASAAIPGILNAVVLMQKIPNSNRLVPYNYGHRFKDGSLRTDIPTQTLHNYFNVNYSIVSQVNPHIHIFFYANQGSPGRPVTHRYGKGWRGGFLASTAEQLLKLELSKWLKLLRDLDLLPKLLNQDWSSIWLQKFDGNVTILPRAGLSDWLYIIADPDEKRLTKLLNAGQLQTWPKIAMIKNRLRIENAIALGRQHIHGLAKSEKRTTTTTARSTAGTATAAVIANDLRNGASSDDNGSGDDIKFLDEYNFLAGRRLSMPSAMDSELGKNLMDEEKQRFKFMSQFTDKDSSPKKRGSSSKQSGNRYTNVKSYLSSDEDDDDDYDDDNEGDALGW
ncbi:acyl transferase/acyl hydrolase/lysophospholipase [Cunninghamella echinulata]|nr:acyl transferase/acyl hydrolase/lysophospholipase [Cunninghamella echinulata]